MVIMQKISYYLVYFKSFVLRRCSHNDFNSFFFHHSKGSQSCDGLCYHVVKLQNCLFCCGVANIIVYLRRVDNLKTDV